MDQYTCSDGLALGLIKQQGGRDLCGLQRGGKRETRQSNGGDEVEVLEPLGGVSIGEGDSQKGGGRMLTVASASTIKAINEQKSTRMPSCSRIEMRILNLIFLPPHCIFVPLRLVVVGSSSGYLQWRFIVVLLAGGRREPPQSSGQLSQRSSFTPTMTKRVSRYGVRTGGMRGGLGRSAKEGSRFVRSSSRVGAEGTPSLE